MNFSKMKKILIISLLTQLNLFAQQYLPFKGKVVDSETQNPIEGVHLRVGNIGTSTNMKGDFLLKIPTKLWSSTLTISAIGYNNFTQKIESFDTLFHSIVLESTSTKLDEVKVYSSAVAIVKSAFNQIESNYFSSPTLLKGFYREVSQDFVTTKYRYLAEAVLEVFKPSYQSSSEGNIYIIQSRKKEFVEADSIQTFFTSATFIPVTYDVVHEKMDFINPKYLYDFNYKIQDITTLDNQDVYVISFTPKNEGSTSWTGKLYINTVDNAFVGIDYVFNNAWLNKNSTDNFRAITTYKAKETKVRYQKIEGKYYLQNVFHTITLHRLRKGKEENIKLEVEFTTTDIETNNVQKPKDGSKAHRSDIFLKAAGVMDELFWGNYTTVLQSIPLQEQLNNLSKKAFNK